MYVLCTKQNDYQCALGVSTNLPEVQTTVQPMGISAVTYNEGHLQRIKMYILGLYNSASFMMFASTNS